MRSIPKETLPPIWTVNHEIRRTIPTIKDLKIAIQALHVVQQLKVDWHEDWQPPLVAEEEQQPVLIPTTKKPRAKALVKKVPTTKPKQTGTEMKKPPCFMCYQTTHSPKKCHMKDLLTADEKLLRANVAGICYSCSAGIHQSKNCKAKKSCGIDGCMKKHHPFFHGAKLP